MKTQDSLLVITGGVSGLGAATAKMIVAGGEPRGMLELSQKSCKPELDNSARPAFFDYFSLPEDMFDGLIIEYRITIPIFGAQRWLARIKHIRQKNRLSRNSELTRIRSGITITNSLRPQKVPSLSTAFIMPSRTVSQTAFSTACLFKKPYKGYSIIDKRNSLKS